MERLHGLLLRHGEDSLVAHAGPPFGYDGEIDLRRGPLGRVADKAWRMATDRSGGPGMWRPSWGAQGRRAEALGPDVVHVHWTYGASSVPLRWICELSRRMPVVWTMHDMWAVTGGCTNPQACERWRDGCGSCPQIAGEPGYEKTMDFDRDVTAALLHRKRSAFAGTRLHGVMPSEWMLERIAASGALDGDRLTVVRNVVDTVVFSPGDRGAARAELGVPPDGLAVLFVGKPGDATAYRGRHPVMLDALGRLREALGPTDASRLVLVVVGAGGGALCDRLEGVRCLPVGSVGSEEAMSRVFAASDVFLDTTQYDNFPAIVQESLSCGVPVVASAVGGIPEMVVDGETGLLAEASDAVAFAAHLREVLLDEPLRARLGATARRLAEAEFSSGTVLSAMLGVYEAAISADRDRRSEGKR